MSQQAYVVVSTMGSGGAFLMAIVERIVRPDEQVPLWTSTHNNAFSATMRPGFDYDWIKAEGGPISPDDFFRDLIITIPDEQPVIISNNTLAWEAIYSRFPDAKVLIVGFDMDDLDEIAKCHFWQLHVDEYNTQSKSNHDNIKTNAPYLFTSPEGTRPEDLTKSEKEAMYNMLKGLALLSGYNLVTVPPEYEGKAVVIKYKDLIYNPDKVLDTLSDITDSTITNFVRTEYMNYLEKHRVFLESID